MNGSRLAGAALVALALAVGAAPAAGDGLGVAVIVGNRTYADERVPEVAYAHNDAEAFKRFVTGRLGFDADNVIDLRDATKAQLESWFGVRGNARGLLWRRVDPSGGSDVVVFYSGHGVPGSGGGGYLLPADSNPDAAELNGYPIDLLYENLGGLRTRSATVYLDACFSGNSPGGTLIRSASPVYVEANLPGAAAGLTVLTAASGAQMASWDEGSGHGLFTEHLLDGLYGAADADGDGRVTAREAKGHLDRTMTHAARRVFGREQDAGLHGDGGAVLSVAPAGGWGSRPPPPPAAFAVVVDPAHARVRLVDHAEAYRAGMMLPPGSYRVEASAAGYETMAETVPHGAAPTMRRIALRRAVPKAGDGLGVAVIVGNRTYADERVPEVAYAHNDAEAFKRFVTGRLGFDADNVIDLRDATMVQLESWFGVRGNARGLLWRRVDPSGGSDVVVFYSGHGVPGSGGGGYLLPADSNPDAAELNGYPIDLLYENLGGLRTRSATVYLDACFSGNSPGGTLIRSASPVYVEANLPGAAAGLTVLTAASGAQMASWDEGSGHGLFTEHLLDGLYGAADADGDGRVTAREAKRHLDRTMTRAARREFGREQDAGLHGDGGAVLSVALAGRWGSRPAPVSAAHRMAPSRLGQPFTILPEPAHARVRLVDHAEAYRAGMMLPPGSYRVEASAEGYETGRETVAHGTVPTVLRIALRKAVPRAGDHFRDCPECPEMVVVPAGTFRMGSPSWEPGRTDREGPAHEVTFHRPFALGVHEVTVAEFGRFVDETGHRTGSSCDVWEGSEWEDRAGLGWRDPGFGQGGGHPVVCASWNDARAYVKWLSLRTGEAYRLPSESEWEYAARAGTETARYWGEGESGQCRYANGADATTAFYGGMRCNDGHAWTAPVGSFEANSWGLRDMLGNVWEWTEDCWNDSYARAPADGSAWEIGDCSHRVFRGGCWGSAPRILRSANRNGRFTGDRNFDIGFRVARTLTP